jgi:hypothetical protein
VSFDFELETTTGSARAARFVTPHGVVESPAFMAVGILPSAERYSSSFVYRFLLSRAQKTIHRKMGSTRAITAGWYVDIGDQLLATFE